MALPSTVEFAIAPAADGFRANPRDLAVVKPPVDILKSSEGMIKTLYGLQDEDKATAYVVVVWQTLTHHHKSMNNAERYPKLLKAIESVFDTSKISMFHATFISEPHSALDAPVTEIVTFTLHDGQSKETLERLVDQLAKSVNAAPKSAGAIHATWGPTVEDDNVVALIIGWTSVDAHWSLVKSDQGISKLIDQIRAVATIDVKHVSLGTH